MHLPPSFITMLMVLASAVAVVVVFRRLKISPVLGYLAAGALIGPYGLRAVTDTDIIAHAAEFGVVFLMFMIGLELSFERLMAMRRHAFGIGGLQVLLGGGLLGLIAWWFGAGVDGAIVIGAGLVLSSTALVLQVVQENKAQTSQLGRLSLAVLLMQDVMVVPVLVLVPLLDNEALPLKEALGNAAVNALLALAVTFLVGRALLRPLFRIVALAGAEIFAAFTLLLVLGVAGAFYYGGLSMALGAFVAGLLVAETEYRHQVEADILPFKSLLLGLFFMFVGMQLDFALLWEQRWLFPTLVLGLMAVKTVITALLARAFGVLRGKAWHAGLLLSQGGEFGLILFGLAGKLGILSPHLTAMLMVTVTVSLALTPLAYTLGRWISRRLAPPLSDTALPKPSMKATFDVKEHVIIIGFGRVGQTIGRLLAEERVPYLAVEMDAGIVTRCRNAGMPIYYGDGAQAEVLKALGVERAACAVVTVNSFQAALRAITSLNLYAPNIPILARSSDLAELKQLEAAGAEIAISEKYEASLQLGREVLRHTHVANSEIDRILEVYRARDYELSAETSLARGMEAETRGGFVRAQTAVSPPV